MHITKTKRKESLCSCGIKRDAAILSCDQGFVQTVAVCAQSVGQDEGKAEHCPQAEETVLLHKPCCQGVHVAHTEVNLFFVSVWRLVHLMPAGKG